MPKFKMNYNRDINKYLKTTIFHPNNENAVDQPSFRGFMQREIPEDLLTEEMKDSEQTSLYVDGDGFSGFHNIVKNLRKDNLTEHLNDKELEKRFWHLFCDVYLHKNQYSDSKVLSSRINTFISEICQPFKIYEVLIPLLNAQFSKMPIQIWDSTILIANEANLNALNVQRNGMFSESINKEFLDRPVISVVVEGNNESLVMGRARSKSALALKILQTYLKQHIGIRDENLLIVLSEFALRRQKDNSSDWRLAWKGKRKSLGITVGDNLYNYIDKASNHYNFIINFNSDLRFRIERAIYWAGWSIEEEIIDHKLIYLCTALEALLTSIDDSRKGETLTYRMVAINHLMEGSFPDPFQLMYFYKLRSRVAHGSALFESTYSDYSALNYIFRKTLFNLLNLAEKLNIKTYSDFVREMDKIDNINIIKSYFTKSNGSWSSSILKILDEKLANNNSNS